MELEAFLKECYLNEKLPPEEMPAIDLYMDQMISLIETAYAHQRRTPKDKLLTKTMIHNYIKSRVLLPAGKKKYTREQLMQTVLLFRLKQSIGLEDLKTLFTFLEPEDTTAFYTDYIALTDKTNEDFTNAVLSLNEDVKKTAGDPAAQKALLTVLLLEQSLHYKQLAEKLIDSMADPV